MGLRSDDYEDYWNDCKYYYDVVVKFIYVGISFR